VSGPPHPAAVVIVADDLSSAADCGAQMAASGVRVHVPLAAPRGGAEEDQEIDVLALDADSRHLPAGRAYAATRACLDHPRVGPDTLVFKSVDSTLRGNLGAEVDAILDTGGFQGAIVAPAFPRQGRTTVDGVQRVHGVPVDKSEFASDPLAPVRCADVAERFAEQSGRRAELVPMDVQRDPGALARRLSAAHAGLLVLDAVEETDLARIAHWAGALAGRFLWVGSTGLARYVPESVGLQARQPRPVDGAARGPVLVVAGSASAITRRQLDACNNGKSFEEVRVQSRAILGGGAACAAEHARARSALARAAARSERVALTLTAGPSDIAASHAIAAARGQPPETASKTLIAAIAGLTRELFDDGVHPRGLVLTGGDTARAVAGALGLDGITLFDEIEPGVPMGHTTDTDAMLIVTKAGGFGGESTLLRSLERIEAHGRR
jgi:uncharacterized protein YgbK (DUF1537 family)